MKDKKTVIVIDSSVTPDGNERTHEVFVNGEMKRVTFKYGENTELPFDTGMKFLQDGFTVIDPETNLPVERPAETDETIRMRLKEGEVIAKYEELTIEALQLRAVRLHGGEALVANDVSKDDLIKFIKPRASNFVSEEEELEIEFDDEPASEDDDDDQPEDEPDDDQQAIDQAVAKVLEKHGADEVAPVGENGNKETVFIVLKDNSEVVRGSLSELLADKEAA